MTHHTSQTRKEDAAGHLLSPDFTQDLRARWDHIQTGFVDEPRAAVQQADELVNSAAQRLTEGFAEARAGSRTAMGPRHRSFDGRLADCTAEIPGFFPEVVRGVGGRRGRAATSPAPRFSELHSPERSGSAQIASQSGL